jgi:hypothetical protein
MSKENENEKGLSVQEAAEKLCIARSTLYGHLSDFEQIFEDEPPTHTIVGGLKVIYPENFLELKRLLACKKTISNFSGTEKPGALKVTSSAKEFERALEFALNLKRTSQKEL